MGKKSKNDSIVNPYMILINIKKYNLGKNQLKYSMMKLSYHSSYKSKTIKLPLNINHKYFKFILPLNNT